MHFRIPSHLRAAALLLLPLVAWACSVSSVGVSTLSPLEEVDPFIGTGGHGHTFPGATLPHGMVQLSPDTRTAGWDACSGYHYSDTTLLGFSHTHLSGTGIADMLDILFRPYGTARSPADIAPAPFRHGEEEARPGYYAVRLADDDIRVELTATARTGHHRYTYAAGAPRGVLIDLEHKVAHHRNRETRLTVISDTEIAGYKYSSGWAKRHPVYFYARFSAPFAFRLFEGEAAVAGPESVGRSGRALLDFGNAERELQVSVGISTVDAAGARGNHRAEAEGGLFDEVLEQATATWERQLAGVSLRGGTKAQRTIFRTAQYHAALAPYLQSDADGRYRTMDQRIGTSTQGPVYTVFSLWDTYRALHPYLSITDPELNGHFVNSLLRKAEEGGVLPKWELVGNYTGSMIGYHAVSVILDAYRKGDRSFDPLKAYHAMLRAASFDTSGIDFPADIVRDRLMPLAKLLNDSLGYIPADLENESVSKALEYAYNDWCIAEMATEMGDAATEARFRERAGRYAHYFDPGTGFFRGLRSDGSWVTPFDPAFSRHRRDEYTEGNAWQWLWYVPHDIDDLVALHGGREGFLRKLDSLFSVSSEVKGEHASNDISGLIGQYAHGNEPSHHVAYLYSHVGRPERTRELVDSIVAGLYFAAPAGLPGNEDCGQMSAWYLMSALGLYQVCPGEPEYTLGYPLFDAATVRLPGGRELTVRRERTRGGRVTLNGDPLPGPTVSHRQLMAGGTLAFPLTPEPTAK